MQFAFNALLKALKLLIDKNNDENTDLKTNIYNLLNAVFYFNTIVKINTYPINLSH